MKRTVVIVLGFVLVISLLLPDTCSAAGKAIKLPNPNFKGSLSVEEAIYKRRSIRSFKDTPVSLAQLSQVLWSAGGPTVDGITGPTRAYASAGGIYPLDIYVVVGDVTGLVPGVYEYKWKSNELIPLRAGDLRGSLARASMGQGMIKVAPFTIVVFAEAGKTGRRYGKRGATKYVPMDAGHMGQNVHLQAEALGLGTVMVGAFSEEQVKNALGINKGEPTYIMPVGYPRK